MIWIIERRPRHGAGEWRGWFGAADFDQAVDALALNADPAYTYRLSRRERSAAL